MCWNLDKLIYLIICNEFPTFLWNKMWHFWKKSINNHFKQPCPGCAQSGRPLEFGYGPLLIINHILMSSKKKSTIYLSWNLQSLKSECFGTFCEGSKSGSGLVFFKCPISQCFRNKGVLWLLHFKDLAPILESSYT